MRESVPQIAARHAGALAIAGLLAFPLLATQWNGPVSARVGDSVAGQGVTGRARVVDGDTLAIGTVRVRLEGIDAPEQDQTCGKPWFGTWKCGRAATEHLEKLTGERDVRCESKGNDAYGRVLGVCFIDGFDLNADMVRNGFAWAFVKYSLRYVEVEAEARGAKRGIWQGEAVPAWQWRAERWKAAEGEKRALGGPQCLIKGNITRQGNIYHMPTDRWYDKTRIETDKGERWFCSEAEAAAAGWRPATLTR